MPTSIRRKTNTTSLRKLATRQSSLENRSYRTNIFQTKLTIFIIAKIPQLEGSRRERLSSLNFGSKPGVGKRISKNRENINFRLGYATSDNFVFMESNFRHRLRVAVPNPATELKCSLRRNGWLEKLPGDVMLPDFKWRRKQFQLQREQSAKRSLDNTFCHKCITKKTYRIVDNSIILIKV